MAGLGHGEHGAQRVEVADRRIAVAEYLQVGPALRLAIAARQPPDALRAEARKAGLVPLREHALALVQQGIIGFAELRSLLSWEQLSNPVT